MIRLLRNKIGIIMILQWRQKASKSVEKVNVRVPTLLKILRMSLVT